MAEITIAGKAVTVRDQWTGRAAFRASVAVDALAPHLRSRDDLRAHADDAYDSYIELCRAAVTAWEFDGDPNDAAAYDALPVPVQWELFGAVLAAAIGGLQVPPTEKKD